MAEFKVGDTIGSIKKGTSKKTITAVDSTGTEVVYTLSDGTVLPEKNIIRNR